MEKIEAWVWTVCQNVTGINFWPPARVFTVMNTWITQILCEIFMFSNPKGEGWSWGFILLGLMLDWKTHIHFLIEVIAIYLTYRQNKASKN